MADQWYYQVFGQEYGPVDFKVVAQKFNGGELGIRDMVRQGKTGTWVRAGTVASLTQADSAVAVETVDVATDIDSFMLVDEKTLPEPQVASDIDSFSIVDETEFKQPEVATNLDSFILVDDKSSNRPKPPSAQHKSAAHSAEVKQDFAAASNVAANQPVARPQPAVSHPRPATVPSPAPAVVDTNWFCYVNDQEYGPMSMADLQGAVAQGSITPMVYVKYGDQGEWVLASQIPDLFPAVAPPTMPAPVTPAAATAASPRSQPINLAEDERTELVHQLLAMVKQGLSPELLHGVQPAAPVVGTGWYCNISGSVIGPVSIESLVQMVLQKRLFPDDLIRMGTTGEWFPAKTVPDLFPETSPQAKKKKSGLDDAESVMDRIDRMYREAQEADAKAAAAKAASPTPAEPPKPAGPRANPAGDALRSMNANIARGAIAGSKGTAKSAPSGPSLGEQLAQLMGGIKLDAKALGVVAVIAVVVAGYFLFPLVLGDMAAKSALTKLVAIHGRLTEAEGTDPTAFAAKSKDLMKEIDDISKTVKGGATGSPKRDVSKMAQQLKSMVEAMGKPKQADAAAGQSDYDRAKRSYDDYFKAACKKMGIK